MLNPTFCQLGTYNYIGTYLEEHMATAIINFLFAYCFFEFGYDEDNDDGDTDFCTLC